jgi:hypothetical protein
MSPETARTEGSCAYPANFEELALLAGDENKAVDALAWNEAAERGEHG